MQTTLDIAKDYLLAFNKKDYGRARTLLADDFRFTGPMLQTTGADTFMDTVKEQMAEVAGDVRVIRAVENGDEAALLYEWVLTAPAKQTIRMSEWFQVKDGRIAAIDLEFDTAKLAPPQ